MVRREVDIGIAEQGLGRGGEFGVVVARAQGFAGVGRSGHGVDIGIVSVAGVRMVIECGDFFDLREEALVDLLDVGTGEGTGLGKGEGGDGDDSKEKSNCESHAGPQGLKPRIQLFAVIAALERCTTQKLRSKFQHPKLENLKPKTEHRKSQLKT